MAWEIKKIQDICLVTDYVANGSFASLRENVKYNSEKDYAILVRTTDYVKNWNKNFVYVSKSAYRFLSKSNLLINDVIISNVGKPGIIFKIPNLGQPMTLGPNSILVRSLNNQNLIQDYLYYLFYSPFGQSLIQSITTGTTQEKFNKTNFRNLEIPVPPLPEQKRIVAILDETFEKLSKAKENAEKNLKNAKEIFESYFEDLLLKIKETNGTKLLGEICEKVEYGSSSKSKKQGKIPVLRMGNIQNGTFDWNNLVYSDNEIENEKYLLRFNDVLFNRTNSPELVGKTAIYKENIPAIFAGYLIRIHKKKEFLNADYLNYFLNAKSTRAYGRTIMSSSVNQANINGTKLKNYKIPLPRLKEQEEIVNKLDNLSQKIKQLESIYTKKLTDLEELKQSILRLI